MRFQCVLPQTRSDSLSSRKVHWGHSFWGRLFCHRDTKQSSFILFEIRKNKGRPTASSLVRVPMGRAMGICYFLPLYTFRSLQHTLLICSCLALKFIKAQWITECWISESEEWNGLIKLQNKVSLSDHQWSRWWHLWLYIAFPSCHCYIKSSWGNFTSGLVVCPELQQSYTNVIC